eukprot:SAG11_NODE_10601_length_818_cov_1.036161_1_plen_144_part_00
MQRPWVHRSHAQPRDAERAVAAQVIAGAQKVAIIARSPLMQLEPHHLHVAELAELLNMGTDLRPCWYVCGPNKRIRALEMVSQNALSSNTPFAQSSRSSHAARTQHRVPQKRPSKRLVRSKREEVECATQKSREIATTTTCTG